MLHLTLKATQRKESLIGAETIFAPGPGMTPGVVSARTSNLDTKMTQGVARVRHTNLDTWIRAGSRVAPLGLGLARAEDTGLNLAIAPDMASTGRVESHLESDAFAARVGAIMKSYQG